jgi:hypothetical protein
VSGLPNGHLELRVVVFVDLALELGQLLLGLVVRLHRSPDLAHLAGERIGVGVDRDVVRAAGQPPDGAAGPGASGEVWHEEYEQFVPRRRQRCDREEGNR